MYLCASVYYVGKTLDHEKVLALLCVPELEFRMHTQFTVQTFSPNGQWSLRSLCEAI